MQCYRGVTHTFKDLKLLIGGFLGWTKGKMKWHIQKHNKTHIVFQLVYCILLTHYMHPGQTCSPPQLPLLLCSRQNSQWASYHPRWWGGHTNSPSVPLCATMPPPPNSAAPVPNLERWEMKGECFFGGLLCCGCEFFMLFNVICFVECIFISFVLLIVI